MKDKTRKTIITIIIAVSAALVVAFAELALYFIIGMSQFYDKSDIRIKIENYIDEYNRSCDSDKQIGIDEYYEGGPYIRCKLKFSEEISADTAAITTFFMKFHNDFGYESFCNAEINSEFFRRYDEVCFEFENIRLSYGDNKVLPDPFNLESTPEDIDAAIYGLDQIIYFDSDTINKFKGTVYAFKLNTEHSV